MKKASKKNKANLIIAVVFIVTGLVAGSIPFLGPLFNQFNQNKVIEKYNDDVSRMTDVEIEEAKEEVRTYNETGRSNYYTAIDSDTVISYIDIPKIDVYLPIYKGTDDNTLEKGIGLLEGTSFPIGGNGTHTVLTGHSGLTTQTMFTNLQNMDIGDIFYLHTYDEELCYKIYDIIVVLPDEVTKYIEFDSEHDYCTLLTCTPIGVNTHRLLIRAVRTENVEETTTTEVTATTNKPTQTKKNDETTSSKPNIDNSYNNALIFCAVISFILEVIGLILFIRTIKSIRRIED